MRRADVEMEIEWTRLRFSFLLFSFFWRSTVSHLFPHLCGVCKMKK